MKLKPYTAAPLAAAGCLFLTLVYGMVSSTADLPAAWRLPVLALAQTVSCMLPAVLFLFAYRDYNARRLRFALPRAESVGTLALLLLCLLIGSALLTLVGKRVGLAGTQTAGTSGAASPVVTILVACILPAVCEEFLFRGVILCAFEACGTRTAIIGTSLLFAFAHLNFERLPLYFFCSVVLCFAVYVSRSLFAAVLLHAVYNVASVYAGVYLSSVAAHLESFALLFIVMLLAFLICVIFTLSAASRTYRAYADAGLPSDYAPRLRYADRLRASASVYFSLPFLLCTLLFAAVMILEMR